MAKTMSVAERDEIKNLLGQSENNEIRDIESHDPEWKRLVEERLRKIAIGRLKVDKECADLAKIESEMQKLKDRRDEIQSAIARKMPMGPRKNSSCPTRLDFCEAVSQISEKLFTSEKQKNPTGRKIADVERKFHKKRELLASCESRQQVNELKVLA